MDTHAIGRGIKDCSQGFCSFYCPQWCYIIFPPPPPLEVFPDDQSFGLNLSPLFITIIGFLAGALLLLGYYAILSNYCRNRFSSATRQDGDNHDVEMPGIHEPWFVATNGLDEALVRSISTFKYMRREGVVQGTDCSVCLNEFVEDEMLKLLPKCSHAFHVTCIDTWFKCHSNCPLCRANVAGGPISSLIPLQSPSDGDRVESSASAENLEQVKGSEASSGSRDGEGNPRIRRSVSMDCVFELRLSIGDCDEEDCESNRQRRCREIECEMRASEMKRSLSSGRWFVSKWG